MTFRPISVAAKQVIDRLEKRLASSGNALKPVARRGNSPGELTGETARTGEVTRVSTPAGAKQGGGSPAPGSNEGGRDIGAPRTRPDENVSKAQPFRQMSRASSDFHFMYGFSRDFMFLAPAVDQIKITNVRCGLRIIASVVCIEGKMTGANSRQVDSGVMCEHQRRLSGTPVNPAHPDRQMKASAAVTRPQTAPIRPVVLASICLCGEGHLNVTSVANTPTVPTIRGSHGPAYGIAAHVSKTHAETIPAVRITALPL